MVKKLGVQWDVGIADKLIEVFVELVEAGDGYSVHCKRRLSRENESERVEALMVLRSTTRTWKASEIFTTGYCEKES